MNSGKGIGVQCIYSSVLGTMTAGPADGTIFHVCTHEVLDEEATVAKNLVLLLVFRAHHNYFR